MFLLRICFQFPYFFHYCHIFSFCCRHISHHCHHTSFHCCHMSFQIPYFLNEDKKWGLDIDELERALEEAKPHCEPRAIVVINPGNPTGQVLSRANIEDIIRFAQRRRLYMLADEVRKFRRRLTLIVLVATIDALGHFETG